MTALALVLPTPAAAAQASIFVSLCNGGLIALPAEPRDKKENDRKDCRAACHAGDSRKRLFRALS